MRMLRSVRREKTSEGVTHGGDVVVRRKAESFFGMRCGRVVECSYSVWVYHYFQFGSCEDVYGRDMQLIWRRYTHKGTYAIERVLAL